MAEGDLNLGVNLSPKGIGGFVKKMNDAMRNVIPGFKRGPVGEEKVGLGGVLKGINEQKGHMKIGGIQMAKMTTIAKGTMTILGIIKKAMSGVFTLLETAVTAILKPIGDFFLILFRPILILFYRLLLLPFYRYVYPAMIKMNSYIMRYLPAIEEELKPLRDEISEGLKGLLDVMEIKGTDIVNAVKLTYEGTKLMLAGLTLIGGAIAYVVMGIADVAGWGKTLAGFGQAVVNVLRLTGILWGKWLGDYFGNLGHQFNKLLGEWGEYLGNLGAGMQKWLGEGFKSAVEGLTWLYNAIIGLPSAIASAITGGAEAVGGWLSQAGKAVGLQEGGTVLETGFAKVHKGEIVIPTTGMHARKGMGGTTNTYYIDIQTTVEKVEKDVDIDILADRLARKFKDKIGAYPA